MSEISTSQQGTPDGAAGDHNAMQVGESRRRPIGSGWRWISQAWPLFSPSWGQWILAVLLFLVIYIGLEMIPLIGPVISMLLAPVLGAGLLYMAHRAREEGVVEIGDLFVGFRQHTGALIGLGALNLLVTLGIVIAVLGPVFASMDMQAMAEMESGAALEQRMIANAGMGLMLAPLIALALMIPWMMAYWFAVPLVFFGNYGIGSALKSSLIASLRNILPMLWLSIIFILLAIVASIPLLLGWLVLLPVIAITSYVMFRDIFSET
ncbi:putative membrane protein [Halospina denitrificans]|uniref:Putative membrane protein n=1 Tax=Halospina denitrificans TaxID=332522 RepID=A0A4R7JL40_9GAMM|nr:BPSS1780 family membrane protein [Halospina denitrificans]TDT37743.1 putative membrane protein [Halospina denitrificans]